MNSYRNLASQKIVDTLATLSSRIGERFPGSGLLRVCQELTVMAEQTSERAQRIARRNIPLLTLVGALLALAAVTVIWLVTKALDLEKSTELTNVMQGVDAGGREIARQPVAHLLPGWRRFRRRQRRRRDFDHALGVDRERGVR